MAHKKARERKRQTKLSFSPAAKSSPATRSSLATTMGNSPSRPNLTPARPVRRAPVRASEIIATDSSSEDELAAETEGGMRLGMPVKSVPHGIFDGSGVNPASSINSEDEDEPQAKTKPASRKRRRATTTSGSEEEEEEEEATITVIPTKRQRRFAVEIEIPDEEEKPKHRVKRRGNRRERTPDGDDDELRTLARSTKRRNPRRPSPAPSVEEVEEQSPPRSTRRSTARKAHIPDDHDDELRTPARSITLRQPRRPSPFPLVEEVEKQSPPRSTRRRIIRRRPRSDEGSEEQSSPEPNRRRSREDSASNQEDRDDDNGGGNDEDDEEHDELKEDLAFLRSSPLPDRGRLRSTHDKPKNKRQQALEALKRKRAGTNEPSSSTTPGRRKPVIVVTDSESELDVIKEEEGSELAIPNDDIEEEEEEEEGEEDRDANALDMFQEDHEDEQFIDDDVNATLGEPADTNDLDEMRLAFSLSRAKTKDLFKYAVEWMVMKKIHPGFDSTNHVYTLTFRKLDDEVKGLAGSKYTSAAWTPDFTRAVRARPNIMINPVSAGIKAYMSAHCEACNRSNHTASAEVTFEGQPYDPETLEPIDPDSDSDSDSDESLVEGEKPCYNINHERILPESHRFPLGSTCEANAQVAHTLYHWRYHLYEWVKMYLDREGHLDAEKIVKRDKWSDRKREKAARKIVDDMEENGQIANLHRLYKDQVKAALEMDNMYKGAHGRYA
ncbi:hypothetical protein EJ02DRAFT_354367 [Clathrospora elynae]|uniref:DUF4211 domain-containing protein n=1 Tax=Clathrospora elynae TaxID=706981 RepID=A0A6A5SFX4_9PLEO|nr:hypothetical protein EJ02DRAFT_354367 [Clathrospora elynae]